jgi:hypothetical protein
MSTAGVLARGFACAGGEGQESNDGTIASRRLAAKGEEMECPVCFLDTRGTKRSSALPCGHVTCKACVDELRDQECPICRKPFNPKKVLDLFL